MTDDVVVLRSVLLYYSYFLYLLNIFLGRTVKDRELRAIDLDETVVDAHGVECCHAVLDGSDAHIALGNDCTALGVNDVLGKGIDCRLSFEVNTLYLKSGVLRCRIECYCQTQTCVKAFPE